MQRRWLVLLVSCAVTMSGVGCQIFSESEAVFVEEQVIEVEEVMTQVEVEGTVEAAHHLALGVQFPAEVTNVHIQEGDSVTEGQPLVTLDTTLYQQQIEQVKVSEELEQMNAALIEQTKSLYVQQKAALEAMLAEQQEAFANKTSPEYLMYKNQLESVMTRQAKLQEDYSVLEELYTLGGVPLDEVEAVAYALEESERDIQNINYQITQLEKSQQQALDTLTNQIKECSIAIANETSQKSGQLVISELTQRLQAMEVEQLENALDKTYLVANQLVAPKDQLVVSKVHVQTGMDTATVVGPMIELIDLESIVVVAKVPEEYLGDLKVGDTVEVVPYTDQNQSLIGSVSSIGGLATDYYGEKVVEAVITIQDTEGLLIVGGRVDVLF